MIRSRLSVLMAERNERQDDLSRATGISKATLSNIANNKTAGIQYEILESLAMYFNVGISDLFEYSPFNIEFERVVEDIQKDTPYTQKQKSNLKMLQKFNEISSPFYLGSKYTVTGALLRKSTDDLLIEILPANYEISEPKITNNYTNVVQVSFGMYAETEGSPILQINQLSSAFKKTVLNKFQDFLIENYANKFKSDGITGTLLVIFGDPTYQFILDLSDN